MDLYTLVTDIGKAKIANATVLGKKIDFVKLKVGDGGGDYYEPNESQTDLVHTVWEGNINNVLTGGEKNPNWIIVQTVIPPEEGGFYIREAGIFDNDDNLLAISKYPECYKPTMSDGSTDDLTIELIFEISNASTINLKIDPLVTLASMQNLYDLESKINKKIENINTQLNDMRYEEAGGTATAITLNIPETLDNGYWKKFIVKADNGGVATTINGKPLYKVCSTNPPNLKANRPYEIYYNATNDCFFLKASATGTTSADKVLAGETFSTENDTDLIGTMPNRGAVTATLNSGGSYTIPKGYHNGSGKVTVNSLATQMANNGVTLTSASQLISEIKAYSKTGQLLTGTATIESLGGKQHFTKTLSSVVKGSTVEIPFVPETITILFYNGGTVATDYSCCYVPELGMFRMTETGVPHYTLSGKTLTATAVWNGKAIIKAYS